MVTCSFVVIGFGAGTIFRLGERGKSQDGAALSRCRKFFCAGAIFFFSPRKNGVYSDSDVQRTCLWLGLFRSSNDVQGVFWVQWGQWPRCLGDLAMNVDVAQALSCLLILSVIGSRPQLAWAMLWFDKRSPGRG